MCVSVLMYPISKYSQSLQIGINIIDKITAFLVTGKHVPVRKKLSYYGKGPRLVEYRCPLLGFDDELYPRPVPVSHIAW